MTDQDENTGHTASTSSTGWFSTLAAIATAPAHDWEAVQVEHNDMVTSMQNLTDYLSHNPPSADPVHTVYSTPSNDPILNSVEYYTLMRKTIPACGRVWQKATAEPVLRLSDLSNLPNIGSLLLQGVQAKKELDLSFAKRNTSFEEEAVRVFALRDESVTGANSDRAVPAAQRSD